MIFKTIKEFFIPPKIKLWCGYYGDEPYWHTYLYHDNIVSEKPSEYNDYSMFIETTTYCTCFEKYKKNKKLFIREYE